MKRLNDVLIFFSGLLILFFTLLANLQVLYRYVLELPLPWVEELARYVMILMVFILSGVAIFRRSHLNVEIVDLFLKGRALLYFDKFKLTIVTIFSICFTILAFNYFQGVIASGQVSPALRISMGIPVASLFIGGIIMTVNSVYMLFFGGSPNNNADAEMRNMV